MPANDWRQLHLKHLEVLRAIAERTSFWGAADLLDCTPSAVSQHLVSLEKITGQRLVQRSRGHRQVELTAAGELLLRHADAVVARLHAAEADFAAYARGAAGPLRVGTYQSVGTKILPRLVREFARDWPEVTVTLEEAASDDLLTDMVERGDLDLTFSVFPLLEGPFQGVKLMNDPYVLVVPQAHPITSLDAMRPRQIAELNLIGFCRCRTVAAVEDHLRSLGIDLKIAFRIEDNGIMQALVAAGVGAAIAPLLAVDEMDPAVRIVELEGFPPRVLALVWHRDRFRSRAMAAFIERAGAICSEIEKRGRGRLASTKRAENLRR